MKIQFKIIAKSKMESNGCIRTRYFLKKTYFGFISIYELSTENFLNNSNNFILSMILAINVFFSILSLFVDEFSGWKHFCISASIIFFYFTCVSCRAKYYSEKEAEEAIKLYIKKRNFNDSSNITCVYNIDTNKGIYEKEINRTS